MSACQRSYGLRIARVCVLVFVTVPAIGGAATIEANPSNYRTVLASLNAGDTLSLAPGTYMNGLPISNKNGTAAQPIVIAGPDDQSAVFKANDCCNTVQLENVSRRFQG